MTSFKNFTNNGVINVNSNNRSNQESKPRDERDKRKGNDYRKKLPSQIETILWKIVEITLYIIAIMLLAKILFFLISPGQVFFLLIVMNFVETYLKAKIK